MASTSTDTNPTQPTPDNTSRELPHTAAQSITARMAITAQSAPIPIYAAPESGCKHHERRRSSQPQRRDSAINLPDSVRSSQACPQDGNAFSYDPTYLEDWFMPQELWLSIPEGIKSSVAAVQHAGAAVLSSFARMSSLRQHALSQTTHKGDEDSSNMKQFDSLIDISPLLRGHYTMHEFLPESPPELSPDASSCPTPSLLATPPSIELPTNLDLSGQGHGSTLSTIPSNSSGNSTLSAIPSTPFISKDSEPRTFVTPQAPHVAYLSTELQHLRSEALVRLRHTARHVDREWADTTRLKPNLAFSTVGQDFEEWWAGKKGLIRELSCRAKQIVLIVEE